MPLTVNNDANRRSKKVPRLFFLSSPYIPYLLPRHTYCAADQRRQPHLNDQTLLGCVLFFPASDFLVVVLAFFSNYAGPFSLLLFPQTHIPTHSLLSPPPAASYYFSFIIISSLVVVGCECLQEKSYVKLNLVGSEGLELAKVPA